MKKPFVINLDSLEILNELSIIEAGELLHAIYNYHKGINEPLSIVTRLAFAPFKNQFDLDKAKFEELRAKRSIAGSCGGRGNVKQKKQLKAKKAIALSNIKEGGENLINQTTPKTLADRRLAFGLEVKKYVETYGRDMCKDFCIYWQETNKSNTKMRFELEKTWNTNLRLSNWAKNNKNFTNGKSTTNTTGAIKSDEWNAETVLLDALALGRAQLARQRDSGII